MCSRSILWETLRVSGPVSVRPAQVKSIPYFATTILLLGSTGSGKSNFIECLSGNSSLGIARNQLEGFTQAVTAYEVVNLKSCYSPVFLVDAPGFADCKISELKVVELIRQWMRKTMPGLGSISYIMYFDRITDTRVPGSKKRLVSLFKHLMGDPKRTAKGVTLVTTMWDELWTETQKERAQARFIQLQSDHWQDLIVHGARAAKFMNTQNSAMEVLQGSIRMLNLHDWPGFDMYKSIHSMPSGPIFCQNLRERIEGLQGRMRGLEDDLQQEPTKACPELVTLLTNELSNVQGDLQVFETELQEFEEESELSRPPVSDVEKKPGRTLVAREALERVGNRFQQLWHSNVDKKASPDSNVPALRQGGDSR